MMSYFIIKKKKKNVSIPLNLKNKAEEHHLNTLKIFLTKANKKLFIVNDKFLLHF
jgi:hypothetical protein